MAEVKKDQVSKPVTTPLTPKADIKKTTPVALTPLFTKDNYMWMIIGGVVVLIGFLLMLGGKNANLNTFDYNVVYSKVRITVAPIVIVAGLMIEIYAIFKKPKQTV